eukprot:TRINITY_DN7197_c0_g1_i1.p1 TRINITY_DN7197_c0_g1~~TRINITY_DN7197_c0_g1_i1.p1  ORF type:complete len:201 (+),score=50.13 TRINITY_DN7197_c0_g1_i1:132-734(+)
MASKSLRTFKVLGVSGTLRKQSVNAGLIRAAKQFVVSSPNLKNDLGLNVEFDIARIDDLPLFNEDGETDQYQNGTAVDRIRKQIVDADAILIATGEYNYTIPAPLKNWIDWGSRVATRTANPFKRKHIALLSAGGYLGGSRSQYHLRQCFVFLDGVIVNSPELMVNRYDPTQFDTDGNLVNEGTKKMVDSVVLSLLSAAK